MWDAFGDRWSQLTFLILLSDGYEGGRTLFSCGGGAAAAEAPVPLPSNVSRLGHDGSGNDVVAVRTGKGSVLCFPHGGHPLHLLHAGERVDSGTKYMVRTELLYRRTPEADQFQKSWFRSG